MVPNRFEAVVASLKIEGYLLSPTHEQGGSKAKFFFRFGFSESNPSELSEALLEHVQTREVIKVTDSDFGQKFTLECEITTPDGRNPCIYSVWIINESGAQPRFVTACPSKKRHSNPD